MYCSRCEELYGKLGAVWGGDGFAVEAIFGVQLTPLCLSSCELLDLPVVCVHILGLEG